MCGLPVSHPGVLATEHSITLPAGQISRGVLPQLVVREGRLVFALKVTQVAMKCLFRVDSVVMFVVVLISEKFTTVWASYLWS